MGWIKEKIWKCTLAGSYTVEASWVVPILLFILEGAMMLGFQIYTESVDYTDTVEPLEMHTAEQFRMLDTGGDIVEGFLPEQSSGEGE